MTGPEKPCRLFLLIFLARSAILRVMLRLVQFVISLFASSVRTQLSLQLEIAALRHQLSVYQHEQRRPHITWADRLL
jgi:hypothetical protein